MILKKNISKVIFIFFASHLILWTLIPSFTNTNLPLDTIEALAWSSKLEWGYYKHPPLSALVVEINYFIFGTHDWAYYLLSQLFVLISFLYVWKLSKEFFNGGLYPLLSILILESIVFFNYTTPEFNVYVCQLPFKALTVYFFWKSINHDNIGDWLMTGVFSALGTLTHYSFLFLIFGLLVYFLFFVEKNQNLIKNFLISFLSFFIICFPHIIWLFENNFSSIYYAFDRAGIQNKNWLSHFYNPVVFLLKQIGLMSLFVILFFSIYRLNRKKINLFKFDKKKLFLICISIIPFLTVLLVSLITGSKIRTMWMSTFYLFNGLLVFYYFQQKINIKRLKYFFSIFIIIFIISPITYAYVSISNDYKRTDYPGREIAILVQDKWNKNFNNEIKIVVGDEWSAGNLSYHLSSRPIWFNDFKGQVSKVDPNKGVVYTGNPKILQKVCPGVFGTIKPVGYCMIGKK